MKYKFFYGGSGNVQSRSAAEFSHNGYTVKMLFQNKLGVPVLVSRHNELGIWKVECGFSSVVFASEEEAMAYCNDRFYTAKGRKL